MRSWSLLVIIVLFVLKVRTQINDHLLKETEGFCNKDKLALFTTDFYAFSIQIADSRMLLQTCFYTQFVHIYCVKSSPQMATLHFSDWISIHMDTSFKFIWRFFSRSTAYTKISNDVGVIPHKELWLANCNYICETCRALERSIASMMFVWIIGTITNNLERYESGCCSFLCCLSNFIWINSIWNRIFKWNNREDR